MVVGMLLEGISQTDGLFVEVPVYLGLVFSRDCRSVGVGLSLWKVNLHCLAASSGDVVHRVGVVEVCSVDQVLNELRLRLLPHRLLLHDPLERVRQRLLVLGLDHFIKSGVEVHDGVVLLTLVLKQRHRPDVAPDLWIVLQKPSVVVFYVQLGLPNKV